MIQGLISGCYNVIEGPISGCCNVIHDQLVRLENLIVGKFYFRIRYVILSMESKVLVKYSMITILIYAH